MRRLVSLQRLLEDESLGLDPVATFIDLDDLVTEIDEAEDDEDLED